MRISIILLLLFAATACVAEEKEQKLPGIKVGESAPDFELKAQNGKSVKLSTLVKKGPVAVVFHRSASW